MRPQTMDLIDALPPGLYEAVFPPKTPKTAHAELVSGKYLVRFERRSLNDIRAIGGNDKEDDRRFAAVAGLSEVNRDALGWRHWRSGSVRHCFCRSTLQHLDSSRRCTKLFARDGGV